MMDNLGWRDNLMMRLRSWFQILMMLLTVSVGAFARAQATYTFTSDPGGDGFTWDITNDVPNDLPDSFGFETPDGVEFVNFTNADAFSPMATPLRPIAR